MKVSLIIPVYNSIKKIKKLLLDDIKIINFPERGGRVALTGVAVPENFENPVTIEFPAEDNRLGFIFMGKSAAFNAVFKNVRGNTQSVSAEMTVLDESRNVLLNKKKEMTLNPGAEEEVRFDASLNEFGFYFLNTRIRDASGIVLAEKEFRFSVVNGGSGKLNNKVGFMDHTAYGHGLAEMERKMRLMAEAGVGRLRLEFNRSETDYESGTYKIDEALMNQVECMAEHGIGLMAILTYGKIPPTTDSEYAEWEKYVEAIVKQLKGKNGDIIYEVWNEYNGAGFNYIGADTSDYVNLLKHTYPVVKRNDESACVNGLVVSPQNTEDNESVEQDAIDWIREVIQNGGGEYMDSACIHTYTHAAAEDFHTKRGMFLGETRELLDEFGYPDMEIQVSEMGWTTPGVTDEIGQASYIVRWAVMVYNQLDEIHWYCNQEKQTTSSHENGFGFIRTWSKGAAGNYPPYGAKPVLLSYANYNSIMTDAVFEKEIEKTENGTHMYQFRLRDGKGAVVAWNSSDAKETIALKLDAPRVTVYDLYGNPTELSPINGKYTMDISGCPIYIVGEFAECEKVEPELLNLTGKVETTENDVAYIHISNKTGKEIELETDLPENIIESARTNEQISFVTGGNSVENEKIHVRIKDKETGGCCYEYEIPVEYRDIVSYELKPSYYRNGRWQCILEIKNNKYSGSVSGTAVIKEPQELADEKTVVQGIADCAFVEDGELVIVDYKTDSDVTAQELAQRYSAQLRIYRRALSECLKMRVKQTLLYSFSLSETIEVSE